MVDVGATLTVGAGSTLDVAGGDVLTVKGTLNMAGMAASPIVITSASLTPGRGDWRGIEFVSNGSAISSGSLAFVQISYAGGDNRDIVNCCTNAGVTIQGANPIITNSTFTNNKGWAVYYSTPPTSFGADSALSAANNDHNDVGFAGGTLGSNATWSASTLGIPLELSDNLVVDVGATLTVGAGSTLDAASGVALAVQGTLDMPGTAASPIVMTAEAGAQTPGDWRGIEFTGTSSGGSLSTCRSPMPAETTEILSIAAPMLE